MPNYPAPVLEIINGSTTINLLARGKGWHLTGFRPRTAELKNGGTWQSSPLSTGRQPVAYRYDNIIDTWTVAADGFNEDGIIELAQDLERAGVDALDYWAADWASTPVYIRARGPKETNTRYAIIHQIRVPEYADQYRQPMFGMTEPVMDGISIIIEHGQWQNVAPGSQECVQVSSTFEWAIQSWEVNSTTPTGDVLAMIELASGRILCGTNDAAKIYYSDDDGDTWGLLATLGTGSDAVNDFCISPTGALIAAVSGAIKGIRRSTNSGSTWSTPASNPSWNGYAVSATSDRIELVGGDSSNGSRGSSNSDFVSSASSFPATISGPYRSHLYGGTFLLMGRDGVIDRAVSTGSTQTQVAVVTGVVRAILQLESGRILAGTSSGYIYGSDNNGVSWSLLSSSLTGGVFSLAQFDSGDILAGGDGTVWVSADDGATWAEETLLPSAEVQSLLITSVNDLEWSWAGDNEQVIVNQFSPVTLGASGSCNNESYSANKAQITNLTNIKVYDASGTSYTDVYPMSAYPVDLLPSVPAANDAVYFGIDTSLADVATGPFSSLVFDLAEPFVGWTDVEWEYWNGSSWGALTVKDSTLSLLQTGVNSVHWVPPSNWATTAVDGVTGYWVRFRVVTVATSPEPPSQQNRNVYAVVNPFVEVAAAQIGGDIPALARIRVENVSDGGGSAPTLYSNRILMGLRSYDRGALFTAFLNASDEQNPVGVTVTAGSDTSFIDAIGAPSGRLAQWSPAGTGSWVTILTFSLATTIATQYYGTFRVFLRARQSGGTAGQMTLRLRTSSGSGGVSITSETKTFANTNDFQILDFGQLTIPLSAYLKATELGDTLTIAVQGNTSSTTPDCNMYDLVLIPVDEWAADLTDGENSAASALASGYYLDVDSVSFPKRQLRNAVKATGTDYTKAIWQQVANGPAILQANARQRLWLLSMRTASAGSTDWRSEPDVVHRVQIWSAERYRWARGAR